ncbi:MAG: hypothetical protein IAF58_03415 [Leptolyngbya sp.]|nr:hypothetical protein [Candidatus Melainabacteria bacterium]
MSTAVNYLLIVPLCVSMLLFALGSATVISMNKGGHPRTVYWNKIFSGLGYLVLTLQGAVVLPYLSGGQALLTLLASVAFAALGIFLLNWGVKLRKKALGK